MLAIRVTYVGELGWELHIPVEFAVAVHDRLTEAGAPFGLANAGYRAIESLRLEKGYRAWGADIGPDHTPLDGRARLGGQAQIRPAVPRARGARERAGRCRASWPASRSKTPKSRFSAARRSFATASASVGSPAAASATPSASRSAMAMCAMRRASTALSSLAEVTNSTWRENASARAPPSRPFTIRRALDSRLKASWAYRRAASAFTPKRTAGRERNTPMTGKRLLIVAHAPSPNTERLRDALIAGAVAGDRRGRGHGAWSLRDDAGGGSVGGRDHPRRDREPWLYERRAERLLRPLLLPVSRPDRRDALRFYIRAGNDGTGAKRGVETIVTGLRWRKIQEPLIFRAPGGMNSSRNAGSWER